MRALTMLETAIMRSLIDNLTITLCQMVLIPTAITIFCPYLVLESVPYSAIFELETLGRPSDNVR